MEMAGPCREFGISRETGCRSSHAITRRVWKGSPTAPAGPIVMPNQLPIQIETLIVLVKQDKRKKKPLVFETSGL